MQTASTIWILLTTLLALVKICSSAASARYLCFVQKVSQNDVPFLNFTLIKNDETMVDVFALDQVDTCSASKGQIKGSGETADPYNIMLDLGNSSTLTACGVQKGAPPNDKVYTIRFVTQEKTPVLTSTDKIYTAVCDFTSMSSTQVILLSGVTVDKSFPSGEVEEDSYFVTLMMIDKKTGSATFDKTITSVTLGNEVALQAELNATGGTPKGVRIVSCFARSASGNTQLTLLNHKGCRDLQSDFNVEFTGKDANGAIAQSGIFKMFRFPVGDIVTFQCTAEFCFRASDSLCSGSHCDIFGRRKKRETQKHENSSVEISTEVKVCDGLNNCEGDPDTVGKTGNKASLSQCFENKTVAAGSGVLMTLLFIMTSLCLLFFCLLMRRQRKAPQRLPRRSGSMESRC